MTRSKARFRLTPTKSLQDARNQVQSFNARHAVDEVVWYWRTLPAGPVTETRIRLAAYVLSTGDGRAFPVCQLNGVAGPVAVCHVGDVQRDRRSTVKPEVIQ